MAAIGTVCCRRVFTQPSRCRSIKESSVGKVKSFYASELGAAHALLCADGACNQHDFTQTILWLSRGKQLLREFRDTCSGTIPPPPPMMSHSAELMGALQPPSDDAAIPTTLIYLTEVFRRLTQKATVLFYHLLEDTVPEADVVSSPSKRPSKSPRKGPSLDGTLALDDLDGKNINKFEIVQMLRTFHETSGATLVTLFYGGAGGMLDATGYRHPCLPPAELSGLQRSFPSVFSRPQLSPASHASIYMIASENDATLSSGGVVCFDESARASRTERDRGSTYYIARVDQSITVALVYVNKGRWRSSSKSKVNDFIAALRKILQRGWQPL